MLENIGIAGDQNGELYFFKRSKETNQSNIWEIERVNSGVGTITHIEGDEERLAIGTRSGVHLWDMNQMKIIPSEVPINIHVAMLCFHYPFVFVIGCNWFENGLKMFDIVTGKLERDLSELGPVNNIHSNGRFLVLSKTSDRVGGYEDKDEERRPKIPCIIILDETELMDFRIKDEDLWVQYFSDNPSQYIMAVSNMTKLVVVTMKSCLTVYDFWKDKDYEMQQEAEMKNNLERIPTQNSRRGGFQVLDTIRSCIYRKKRHTYT